MQLLLVQSPNYHLHSAILATNEVIQVTNYQSYLIAVFYLFTCLCIETMWLDTY